MDDQLDRARAQGPAEPRPSDGPADGRRGERLATTERGDVVRLQGIEPPEWRLRVGDWRVRFQYDFESRTMRVLRVLPRGRAYRD